MNYEQHMKTCINLAKQAEGNTSPNPLVGCVVLDRNHNLISTGFHEKYGENHAERNALSKLDKKVCEGGTLIVNLEPCSHYGKTPPCADLIIEYGIKKVVVGMRDVNPIVAGNGIRKLKDAGIEVIEGVLETECKKLNEVFIKNMLQKKTFIAIKTATTLDGKIATSTGSSKWITSENARAEVKNIRNRYDALLTTSSTVIADNPQMTHRCNIILDRNLKTLKDYKIYSNKRVIVFHDEKLTPQTNNAEFIKTPVVNDKLDLDFIFTKLYEMKIMSVLIEAGGNLNGSALPHADKIYHFIAPKITNDNSSKSAFDGVKITDICECCNVKFDEIKTFSPDILVTYTKS